jgi:hypothetical protein
LVAKLSNSAIGQLIDPVEPSTFDVVVSDSAMPSASSTFHLG